MIWSPPEDRQPPWEQLLAAYADGELSGPAYRHIKAQVEAWLAAHPEAAAELEANARLRQLVQGCSPTDPPEEGWNQLRERIKRRLRRRAAFTAVPYAARWLLLGGLATLGTAAALWLALTLLTRSELDRIAPKVLPEQNAQVLPFPVVTEEEIEILAVHGADTGTVVVGKMPLHDPVVLAQPGDVTVTRVQPAGNDNMVPDVKVEGTGSPMIWARLEGERQQ
jgi:anti-sigma factor RsiW